jgi:uncharacterized membrane protein YagU involved in acid resistance
MMDKTKQITLLHGALAGCVATLPMTLVMSIIHRQLPPQERYPQEPSLIMQQIEQTLLPDRDLREPEHMALTLVSHFVYGAVAGTLYPPLTRHLPLPSALRGAGYGMAVWALGYMGWLPLTGLLPPETRRPAHRTAMIFTAHLVWGLTLGMLVQRRQPAYP